MIYVWILSYFACYLLGVFTLAVALIVIATQHDKKVDRVEAELVKYGEAQPAIRTPVRSGTIWN